MRGIATRLTGLSRWLRALVAFALVLPLTAAAEAIPVEVVRRPEGGWQLLRGGAPWVIRGAGGDAACQRDRITGHRRAERAGVRRFAV